jgi:hypothetical protein
MKAKSALIASISTVGIACTAHAQDFTSAGGVAIPVGSGGPFTVDLIIGASGTIADLDVTTNFASHAWVGDLNVTLTHVDTGTTVAIFQDVGPGTGFSNDLSGAYRFDDESANSFIVAAGSGNPVPTGTYFASNAAEAQTFLSAFDGQNINGTWRLSITDDYPNSAGGQLTNFTLHMTVPAPGALGLLGAAGLAGLGRRRSRR